MLRNLLLICLSFVPLCPLFPQTNHRDSTDVLNYIIHLDLSKTETGQVWGKTVIRFLPIYQTSEVKFDLEGLKTDSVIFRNKQLDFEHNSAVLDIHWPTLLLPQETCEISVYYHGHPIKDSEWGGFFIDKDYAFNYGVGMNSIPPNYGRVWYPCIDNFTDKAEYEYFIKTRSNHLASCGGLLLSETQQPDGTKLFHWKLNQSIPTYLSSVAVGNYSVVKDTVQGMERIIPIEIYIEKGREKTVDRTFAYLKKMIHAFEYRFGPYKWDKIGYTSTEFMYGAMEHATNIAYSNYCNGTTSCESTIVHELSHHWFGDLVTCSTAKDMWLNEGWASYCEAIYYEYVGGTAAYKNYVRQNHKGVLEYALNNPLAYGSLYGMPPAETYSTVVYHKGADVAHTLRGQIGDSLFFATLRQFFIDYAFKNISVEEFKNYLSKKTNLNLNTFFDFWIYSPGFTHFSIQDIKVKPLKNKYQLEFVISQELLNTSKYLDSTFIEIGVLDRNLKLNLYRLKHAGKSINQTFLLDYEPKMLIIDPEEKISDALTDEYLIVNKASTYLFENEKLSLIVDKLSNPEFYHVGYHWIKPVGKINGTKSLKTNGKYWEINSFSNGLVETGARFYFDLETGLFEQLGTTRLDDLCLLYRENTNTEWQVISQKPEIKGSEGTFFIKNINNGQYVIGVKKQ